MNKTSVGVIVFSKVYLLLRYIVMSSPIGWVHTQNNHWLTNFTHWYYVISIHKSCPWSSEQTVLTTGKGLRVNVDFVSCVICQRYKRHYFCEKIFYGAFSHVIDICICILIYVSGQATLPLAWNLIKWLFLLWVFMYVCTFSVAGSCSFLLLITPSSLICIFSPPFSLCRLIALG